MRVDLHDGPQAGALCEFLHDLDRDSGSSVFDRVPDVVLDIAELVLEAVIDKMMGKSEYVLRDDVRKAMGWSNPTVKRWVDDFVRFERCINPRTGRASIRRRPAGAASDVGATSGLGLSDAGKGEEARGELSIV